MPVPFYAFIGTLHGPDTLFTGKSGARPVPGSVIDIVRHDCVPIFLRLEWDRTLAGIISCLRPHGLGLESWEFYIKFRAEGWLIKHV